MSSERSQVLSLLATRRIDVAEAERLLVLIGGRDRFVTLFFWLALWTVAVLAASSGGSQYHFGENLHAALQSVTGSDAFHHLHLFFCRLLGELP
jgi:hypothetical protein